MSKDRITSHPFPLGTSRVTFIAVDNEGAHSEATLQIWVVDTTPPELGPVDTSIYCAAAPNHKYIKLELGDEVMVTVNDICDPNPTVTFVDALCDELDNGIGDGNTTDDIVLFPDAVCLRSERSGVEDGRKYTVAISAEDFRGNKSAGEFDIRVDHDQRDHDCPPLPPSTFISHSDALLQCPAPPADSAQVSKTELETEVGCAVVSNGNLTILPTLCAFFLLLFLRKSRTT